METFTQKKINDAVRVAKQLGLQGNDFEIGLFKDALKQIAAAAIDDANDTIGKAMRDECNKYLLT